MSAACVCVCVSSRIICFNSIHFSCDDLVGCSAAATRVVFTILRWLCMILFADTHNKAACW